MKFFSRNKSILFSQISLLERQIKQEEEKAKLYKEKWKQARTHLRQANKGAEKNAIALKLTIFQLSELQKLTIKLINETNKQETTEEKREI